MLSTNRPIYNNYIYKLSDRNAASTTDTDDLYRTNQLLREIVDNTAYNYTYDVLGNITAITKGTRTNTDTDDIATGGFASYRSYEYDALSQLTRENNISTGLTTVWDYDVLGNIESATRYIHNTGTLSAPPMSRVDYIYGDGGTGWNNLLTELKHYQWQYSNGTLSPVLVDTESFAYDAIGNPTTYRDNTLTWDGRQLASYNGISYTYDADGMRASKISGTAKTEYFYSGDKLVYQVVSDTVTGEKTYELYFLYDSYGHLTAIRYVTATKDHYYYVSTNVQGDVLGIYTAGGVLLASYEYDAWGNCTVTSHNANYNIGDLNPIRYRGYYYDTETELYYCASRYYDAEIGRFINADTIDVLVATPSELTDKNLFAYCDNNPITRKDVGGDFWNVIVGAVVGAAINFVSSAISATIDGNFTWEDAGKIGISTLIGAIEGAATSVCPSASAAISAGASALDTAINGFIDGGNFGEVITDSLISGAVGAVSGSGGSSFTKGGNLINDAANSIGNSVRKGVHPTVKKAAKKTIKKATKKIAREYISGQLEDFAYGGIYKFGSYTTKAMMRKYCMNI